MGSALDFLLDTRGSGTFIIDPLGRFRSEEIKRKKMNLGTEFIPEPTTTSTTSTTESLTTTTSIMLPSEMIPTTKMVEITSVKPDLSWPPVVNREKFIEGLSELEKDIFIISLSGLVLILMLLLVVICIKWRKSKGQRYEIHNMSAGSSMSIFNASKID